MRYLRCLRLRLIGFSVLLLALAACGSTGIPASVNYATLNFVVTDAATGAPIVGAQVIVDSTLGTGQVTSSAGTVAIYPVPPGPFNYAVSATGYQTLTNPSGSVAQGQTLTVPVQLHK
ncbi:MAG: carboxypeptidase regulatory-like domain-containing protein [bacterium]|nr:carboxypeptidase regulatory-like domain-containing protein [bacterium]